MKYNQQTLMLLSTDQSLQAALIIIIGQIIIRAIMMVIERGAVLLISLIAH
jgi:hypothetical protein